MSNRKLSVGRQFFTVACLSIAWLLLKARRASKSNIQSTLPALPDYRINHPLTGVLTILAFAADLYAIPAVLRNKPAISEAEFAAVRASQISPFNRIALKQNAAQKDHYRLMSDQVLRGIIALPALLFLDKRARHDAGAILMMYAWLHAITYTVYSYSPLGPAFNDKYRPVVYYNAVTEPERSKGNNRNSWYSGHTGNAAFASFFMVRIYSNYHPDRSLAAKLLLYTTACVPPMLLGWLRVKALKHFPSDVLLAISIGGSCGGMLPELYNRNA